MSAKGHLFLLTGPSGSGKTTIIGELLERIPELRFVPTTTTRRPRPGEEDGVHYWFISEQAFIRQEEAGEFLEWKVIHGNRYGTSKKRLGKAIEQGVLGIMSVDILGGMEIRKFFPPASTAIFVRPSSAEDLRRRLEARGDPGEEIAVRLRRVDMELNRAQECDFVVINEQGRLKQAVDDIEAIIRRRAPHLCG